jgi:hypothetical protein
MGKRPGKAWFVDGEPHATDTPNERFSTGASDPG